MCGIVLGSEEVKQPKLQTDYKSKRPMPSHDWRQTHSLGQTTFSHPFASRLLTYQLTSL